MKIRSVVLREVTIRQTDRQTNKQTPVKHNLFGGDNDDVDDMIMSGKSHQNC